MTAVLVLAECGGTDGGKVRKTTLELLTIARRLGEPMAVMCGQASDETVELLAMHGATAVYLSDTPGMDDYLVVPKVEVLAAVVQRTAPAAVLVASSVDAKDTAARLAVRLGAGIVTDAVDVQPGTDGPVVTQSVFAGSWTVRSQVRRGTPIITVQPNAARPEPVTGTTPIAVHSVAVELTDAARGARVVSRTRRTASGRPELAEA